MHIEEFIKYYGGAKNTILIENWHCAPVEWTHIEKSFDYMMCNAKYVQSFSFNLSGTKSEPKLFVMPTTYKKYKEGTPLTVSMLVDKCDNDSNDIYLDPSLYGIAKGDKIYNEYGDRVIEKFHIYPYTTKSGCYMIIFFKDDLDKKIDLLKDKAHKEVFYDSDTAKLKPIDKIETLSDCINEITNKTTHTAESASDALRKVCEKVAIDCKVYSGFELPYKTNVENYAKAINDCMSIVNLAMSGGEDYNPFQGFTTKQLKKEIARRKESKKESEKQRVFEVTGKTGEINTYCRKCENKVYDHYKYCPQCGYNLKEK